MNFKSIIGALSLSFFIAAPSYAEHIRMAVKENTVACYGNDDGCLLVKTGKALDWSSLATPIKGFKYEEGYRYVIIVDKKLKKGSKSEYEYKFVKLLKQEAMAMPAAASYEHIVNKKWHLTYFKEQDVASEGMTMQLADGRINLRGLCNNYGTRYTVSGQTLSTGITTGTMKSCGNKDDIESKYIKAFDSKHLTYALNDDMLLLYNKSEHIMTFSAHLENREVDQLAKYDWKVYKIDSTLMTNKNIRTNLSFDPTTNKVYGNDGCNSFFGTFDIVKNAITFDQMGTTMMACLDQERNQVSNKFQKLFQNKNLTFSFIENRLYFYNEGKAVMIFDKKEKEKNNKY